MPKVKESGDFNMLVTANVKPQVFVNNAIEKAIFACQHDWLSGSERKWLMATLQQEFRDFVWSDDNSKDTTLQFNFSGITLLVQWDSEFALLLRDYHRAKLGQIGRNVGPHPESAPKAASALQPVTKSEPVYNNTCCV